MNKDCLRTGDKATVHFRFIKTPEYLHCDHKLVFREGRTKAVGTITKVPELTVTFILASYQILFNACCNLYGLGLQFQLLQSVMTQAAKAQQSKTQAKKTFKDPNEEAGSAPRPSSPTAAQLPVSKEPQPLHFN